VATWKTQQKRFATQSLCGALWGGAIFLLLSTQLGAAQPTGDSGQLFSDNLKVHGFLSQGIVNTSDNRWFGDSPDTSYEFTEAALNASYRITPKFLVSGQLLMRLAGDMYDGSPTLDYGLADLTFLSTPAHRLGVRAGRIKLPLGLYNETRDIPFTRPGIFLPQVVYFERVRNLLLSFDGAMLYADIYRDFGTVSFLAGVGRSVIDENVEWSFLLNDYPGEMEPDSPTTVARLWYSSPMDRIHFGISGMSVPMRFDPDPNASFTLAAGTTDVIYYGIASFQYNTEAWTLSAEYYREPIEWRNYGPFFPDLDFTSEGWYVQAQYRFHPSVELMVRWGEGYADEDDHDGDGNGITSATGVPGSNNYSKIFTAGVRYDINEHWMVRAEYAYHEGTFILSNRENPDLFDRTKYWNMFAFQLAFRF
jgi:hypothetical protein